MLVQVQFWQDISFMMIVNNYYSSCNNIIAVPFFLNDILFDEIPQCLGAVGKTVILCKLVKFPEQLLFKAYAESNHAHSNTNFRKSNTCFGICKSQIIKKSFFLSSFTGCFAKRPRILLYNRWVLIQDTPAIILCHSDFQGFSWKFFPAEQI